MKAKNYNQVLRACGYKARELSEYEGLCVYVKEHKFNRIICYVRKDSHGKGQEMIFNIYRTLTMPKDMTEFNEQEFDRSYLAKEANMIHDAFEKLKELKAPKRLYCF